MGVGGLYLFSVGGPSYLQEYITKLPLWGLGGFTPPLGLGGFTSFLFGGLFFIMTLYKANILHTPTPQAFEVLPHGYIAVDDNGKIEGIYPVLPDHLRGADVIDYGDSLLIPAMNDLHLHAPQYRNMGMAMDLQLLDWLQQYTFPEEARFAAIDYAREVYTQLADDLVRHGTMRSAIFASIHPEATLLLADILTERGLGAMVGLVGMNRNSPDYLQNTTADVVRDTERLMAHLDGNTLVRPIVTPRFVPSCTDDMLDALGTLAQRHGLPVQSHLSENVSEIAWVRELQSEATCYGDAYYRHGLFGQTPTLMAHCCYTDGEELELMRRQGVVAVHCPTSNCNIASGMAHVRHLLDNGIRVALGSDISGGHCLSMFRVMQYTLQVSKLIHAQTQGQEHFLTFAEAFWLATKAGGEFFGKVGAFLKGYDFDALVIDDARLDAPRYPLVSRLERYTYLGSEQDITHRFCCGREVVGPVRLK